jgi:type IV fimbrial biogenesis protein FimT
MNKHTTPTAAFVSTTRLALRRTGCRTKGFTLIELLVAMTVAAILLAFGIPSMASIMNSNKLTAASNALLSSMRLARSEAFKRNGRVIVCKSANGVSCSSTGGWEQGWIVFHDADNDGDRDAGEVLIERSQALPDSLRLTGNSTVAKYVSFVASGTARMAGGGFQAGTVTVCNLSATSGEARQIILNAVGRPRVQRVAVSSCA